MNLKFANFLAYLVLPFLFLVSSCMENNELADTLGNFVNRAFAFAKKHFDGKVPAPSTYSDLDQAIVKALESTSERVGELIENYRFRDALEEAMAQ